MEIATKFVNWEVTQLSALQDSKAYQLREHLNKGEKMNRIEKNWLTEAINDNTYFRCEYRLGDGDLILPI